MKDTKRNESAVKRAANWLRKYADKVADGDEREAFEVISLADDLEHERGVDTGKKTLDQLLYDDAVTDLKTVVWSFISRGMEKSKLRAAFERALEG